MSAILFVHTFLELCEDMDGDGNAFDCSDEPTNKVVKTRTACAATGCKASTCCGVCFSCFVVDE